MVRFILIVRNDRYKNVMSKKPLHLAINFSYLDHTGNVSNQ